MKIKLSQFTLRKIEGSIITPKVRTFTKITLEKICLELDVIHVMRKDTMLENVLETKMSHKKKGNKRIHHAHAAEDDEPSTKRTRYESEDSSSEEEYVLISTLTGNITHGSNDWLIDSGASKHVIGFKEFFVRLSVISQNKFILIV